MIDVSESGSSLVSVWTPWGEQKVERAESKAALMRRAAKRLRSSNELSAIPDFSEKAWPAG